MAFKDNFTISFFVIGAIMSIGLHAIGFTCIDIQFQTTLNVNLQQGKESVQLNLAPPPENQEIEPLNEPVKKQEPLEEVRKLDPLKPKIKDYKISKTPIARPKTADVLQKKPIQKIKKKRPQEIASKKDDGVKSKNADDLAIYNPKPHYPLNAKRNGLEGEVALNIEVLPSGKVGQIKVGSSSGHGILDRAAIKALKRWQFPKNVQGHGKSMWVKKTIEFDLTDIE